MTRTLKKTQKTMMKRKPKNTEAPKRFVCPLCTAIFNSKFELDLHVRVCISRREDEGKHKQAVEVKKSC